MSHSRENTHGAKDDDGEGDGVQRPDPLGAGTAGAAEDDDGEGEGVQRPDPLGAGPEAGDLMTIMQPSSL